MEAAGRAARLAPIHIPQGTALPGLPAVRTRSIVRPQGHVPDALDIARNRLFILGALFVVCFMVLAARLLEVTVIDRPDPRRPQVMEPPVERVALTDRQGVVLSTNLRTASLYADTTKLIDVDEAIAKLSHTLPDLPLAELDAKLRSGKKFVWLKRNLTPRQEWEVNSLGLPGLAFQYDEHRVYPNGRLAAHALGFVDIDSKGISGLENYFDDTLRDPARDGAPLPLSLDLRIQHAVTDELQAAVDHFQAIGGMAVVMDVRTGEVVSLVSLPDFDPNDPRTATPTARFNRATLGTYEMGSVMKIFNTAMALDTGTVTLRSAYDVSNPIKIARFTIHDDEPMHRALTVPEIFMYSSNIGSAKMAIDAGAEKQRAFLDRMGMLRKIPFELPEMGTPQYPNPWRDISVMTIAFGHGISITPLHVARGLAAVVNGGILFQPSLLKADPSRPPMGVRVMSSETSATMRRLLRLVVTNGTGRKADVPGYFLGGKTGTAEKAHAGGYAKKAVLTTFAAAFPMTEPRYVLVVSLDEPKPQKETYGWITAGWNAAPTAGKIVARIAPMLGIAPSAGPDPVDQGPPLVNGIATKD